MAISGSSSVRAWPSPGSCQETRRRHTLTANVARSPTASWLAIISPLAAEIILQALRPVVFEHFDIKTSRASVADIKGVDVDGIDDV